MENLNKELLMPINNNLNHDGRFKKLTLENAGKFPFVWCETRPFHGRWSLYLAPRDYGQGKIGGHICIIIAGSRALL
jgi:hypothetical protein